MINYNPKDWFTFIFRMHRTDTVRRLAPLMGFMALYTLCCVLLEKQFPASGIGAHLKQIGTMHTLLSFVISMLLVFRINSSYDRWWEGRRLWGSLVNNSRNLAIKLKVLCKEDPKVIRYFMQMIPNYAFALKNHLRNQYITAELEFGEDEIVEYSPDKHVPNALAGFIIEKIYQLRKSDTINAEELLTLNAEMQSFTEICGACERIKNSPIPYSYGAFLKKFIFIFVMTLPLSLGYSMGYVAVPVVVIIVYALTSLELIAEEIENPFGTDANDLPLDDICKNIRKSVREIMPDPGHDAVRG